MRGALEEDLKREHEGNVKWHDLVKLNSSFQVEEYLKSMIPHLTFNAETKCA
jgi:hypothetical protein